MNIFKKIDIGELKKFTEQEKKELNERMDMVYKDAVIESRTIQILSVEASKHAYITF